MRDREGKRNALPSDTLTQRYEAQRQHEIEKPELRKLEAELLEKVQAIADRLLPALESIEERQDFKLAVRVSGMEPSTLLRIGLGRGLVGDLLAAAEGATEPLATYRSQIRRALEEARGGLDDTYVSPKVAYKHILGLATGIATADKITLQRLATFNLKYGEALGIVSKLPQNKRTPMLPALTTGIASPGFSGSPERQVTSGPSDTA